MIITVGSGITSSGIILGNEDYMDVSSGSVANGTTVNSGGTMWVFSGGTALSIKDNGGFVYVADGARVTFVSNTFTGITLRSYDSMTVH